MARILGVGIAALDIINTVADYPREDTEVRALAQRVARGGNATNTLVVLSQLGHEGYWGGVLGGNRDADAIRADLTRYNIDMRYVRHEPAGKAPTSYITVNRHNGSRTIVHYRDLPEFGYRDFERIDLTMFDWLHFEGRNVADTRKMLDHALQIVDSGRISVEIEKMRDGIEMLYEGPGLLFFSKPYVLASGAASAIEFLETLRGRSLAAELVCPWGSEGAFAIPAGTREVLHRPACPPPRLTDTIGAGDTFIAGYIDARLRGDGVASALEHACRIAGRKCGTLGFDLALSAS